MPQISSDTWTVNTKKKKNHCLVYLLRHRKLGHRYSPPIDWILKAMEGVVIDLVTNLLKKGFF